MATRRIKVLSTVGVSGTIETNVTNLGELKPLLRNQNINFDGMKMMVGETRNELSLDEAALPEGDFKLYLMPAKTKSGANASYTMNEIADLFSQLSAKFEALADISEDTGSKIATQLVDEDVRDLQRLAQGRTSTQEVEEDDWL